MNTKLIVFDLDGTLLDVEQQLHQKTIKAVKMIREKGIKVMVATGRMYCSAKPHTDRLEIEEPIITYNGALVIDPENQAEIFHDPIPLEIAKRITKMLVGKNYHLQLFINDNLYVAEENEFTTKYEDLSGIEANIVGRLDKFIKEAPTKMMIIEDDEEKQLEIHNFLEDNFNSEIEIASSYPSFTEITAKGISKAVPLKKLAEKFEIKQEEIMAFGDGLNDLKMIEWAGKGVAMGNAHPDLRRAADDIALNHNDLGIARYLKEYFQLDLNIEEE